MSAETSDDEKPAPPAAVGSFDSSLSQVRKQIFLQWTRTVFILCIFVLAVLSPFWGSQFATEAKYPSLHVWVVDFDGQIDPYKTNDTLIGPLVTNVTKECCVL